MSVTEATTAEVERGAMTTASLSASDSVAYWREVVCATFFKVYANPMSPEFRGTIKHVRIGPMRMSTIVSTPQHVRRTPRQIDSTHEPQLLANIQLRGTGGVVQDGREASLAPGDMCFYDSSRPYELKFEGPFEQLVLQVRALDITAGPTTGMTAIPLARDAVGSVYPSFFVSLLRAAETKPAQALSLVPSALALWTAAAASADIRDRRSDHLEPSREAVEANVQARLWDPQLTADSVALACHLSRRTLYRLFTGEGFGHYVTRLRVQKAQGLLAAWPNRSVASIATECGFGSESAFHRAFKRETGASATTYRRSFTDWHTTQVAAARIDS